MGAAAPSVEPLRVAFLAKYWGMVRVVGRVWSILVRVLTTKDSKLGILIVRDDLLELLVDMLGVIFKSRGDWDSRVSSSDKGHLPRQDSHGAVNDAEVLDRVGLSIVALVVDHVGRGIRARRSVSFPSAMTQVILVLLDGGRGAPHVVRGIETSTAMLTASEYRLTLNVHLYSIN